MRLKLIFAVGALAGVALAARRRNQKALDEGDRWSSVTDPVPSVAEPVPPVAGPVPPVA
ncbi:MAG TPA: DLW-39 family protein [Propionibacteriaceae bacterium]|nr:DLW-39 family protein [Propionibacteriaceae bacterium]